LASKDEFEEYKSIVMGVTPEDLKEWAKPIIEEKATCALEL
jgi:hypothetical protein